MKSLRTRLAPRTLNAPSFDPVYSPRGPEDAAGFHFVGLAEKLDEDGHAIDVACPPEARLPLLEAYLLQVLLQGAVGLRRLVTERETNDQVNVCRTDMCRYAVGELPDQVPGGQPAGQVDALAPGTEVAEQRDQGTFASCGGLFVVVSAVPTVAQKPITSRRRLSACSRPRRGSRRRST